MHESGKVATYRIPETVAMTEVSDEYVLLDLEKGEYFSLNPVGRRMMDLILEGHDEGELESILTTEYDIDGDTVMNDCKTLIDELVSAGLLERTSESGASA